MPDGLSESDFDRAADSALKALDHALNQMEDDLEADLSGGILTIEFRDGAKYVVNSHRAARQIWMAADRTAWHFDFDAGTKAWTATKGGEELTATLEAALTQKLGRPVTLER